MKHVLKRFVTLALIVALLAAVSPAILPTASAAEAVLETASEGTIGLAVSSDGGAWDLNEYGYWGGTQTVQAPACEQSTGTVLVPVAGKLILKNDTSMPATLSFDYEILLNGGSIQIDGAYVTAGGSFSKELRAWQSVDIDVLSPEGAQLRTGIQLSNLSFTVTEQITVTFAAPSAGSGSYTITYTDEQGVTHSNFAVTQDHPVTLDFGETVAVSATPGVNKTFLGWFTREDFTRLSSEAQCDLAVPGTCTVYPYFYETGTMRFKVGEAEFDNLNAADAYATEHNNEPIILVSSGTLYVNNGNNGVYTISRGNTLLIPCDDNYTLNITDPEAVAQIPAFDGKTGPYCTMTIPQGVTLNVNGTLCLAGKQNMEKPCLGATVGEFGYIQLEGGSNITVNNGGRLCCWGYITGAGTVNARKGATVYEPFQVMDFRGGAASVGMLQNVNGGTFPFSQYYVQNIESRLTLEYGAKELVRSATNAGGSLTAATVPFIDMADSGALFQMDVGCRFIKYYDYEHDRLCFEVNGDCSINSISLTIAGGEGGLTINSAEYTMPLNGDFKVDVQSGTLTCNQDMYIQPGAEIQIDDGAEMVVPSGVEVVIYDSSEWGTYCSPRYEDNHSENVPFCPIRYTPSGSENIREVPQADQDGHYSSSIPDAKVDVNGQITIYGAVYTTESGACVTSTEGTGKIMFEAAAPADSTVSQNVSNSSATSINVNSVQLYYGKDENNNDIYISTEGITAGTPFTGDPEASGGGWAGAPSFNLTYSIMGTVDQTLSETANNVSGTTLPASVSFAPTNYTFVGWSTTELENEHTEATILTGEYYPSANTTLYAVYAREAEEINRVTSDANLSGDYLIVYEAGGLAFNSSKSDTVNDLSAANNFVSAEIDSEHSTITADHEKYTELKNAAVHIEPAGNNLPGYVIRIHGGKSLGNTGASSNNKINLNAVNAEPYRNTISIAANGNATIQNILGSGGASSNNSTVYTFKYSTSSSSTRFCFYTASTNAYHLPVLYRVGKEYYTTKLPGCLDGHPSTTTETTLPTCTKGGYTTYTCTVCGATWKDDYTERAPHSYDDGVTLPATETEQGYTTYTCTVCGYVYKDNYTGPLGHTYTVNFYLNGNLYLTDSQHYNNLNGYGLPVLTAAELEAVPAGYTFRGWTDAPINGPLDATSATVLSGYYYPQADVNLYAVFTRASARSEENNGDYIKVASGDPIYDGGKYLFVYEGENQSLTGCKAFYTAGDRVDEENAADVTVDDTGDRYRIAATSALDEGAVTIHYAFGTDAYNIKAGSQYLGNTGSAGINANAHNAYLNKLSVDASGFVSAKAVESEERYSLRYNTETHVFKFFSGTYSKATSVSLYYKDGTGNQINYATNPTACDHRNESEVVTPPTCTEGGYTTYTCDDCGRVEVRDATAALGHAYNDGVTMNATAADDGWIGTYMVFTCSRCGDTYEANYAGAKYNVTFSVRGHEIEMEDVDSYLGITLPTTATAVFGENAPEGTEDVFGYEFVGWSELSIPDEVEVASAPKGIVYHPTANVTLYATYARFVNSDLGLRDYARVTRETNFAAGGKVLIVCEDYDGNGNAAAFMTTLDPVSSEGNHEIVDINNGIISSDSNQNLANYEIAIQPVAGNPGYYTMQLANGKYIGSTGTSTGINQNNRPNYRITINIDTSHDRDTAVIQNVGGRNTYNFRYNTTYNRFGFYTPSNNQAEEVALYYREGTQFKMYYTTNPGIHTHEYELYEETPATCTTAGQKIEVCICGDVQTTTIAALGHDLVFQGYDPDPTCTQAGAAVYTCTRCDYIETTVIPASAHVDEDYDGFCDECAEPMPRFESAALVLSNNFDVAYTAILPDGFESASVSFTLGNDAPVVISDYVDNGDSTYTFYFKGVNPQRMGDNISATLTVVADNTEGDPTTYTDTKATYSIREYCLNKLADDKISAQLRKLLSDTLAYGAAAQTYMNYRTDALVTADASNPTYSTFSNLSGLGASFEGTADANTYWISAGLTLTNSVAMTFRFHANSTSGLKVRVTLDGETTDITEFTSVNGAYVAYFNGISAEDFGKTVTVKFYKNNAQVGDTLSYSVNAYVCAKQNDTNANLANLVKALYNYGASAAAYAAN